MEEEKVFFYTDSHPFKNEIFFGPDLDKEHTKPFNELDVSGSIDCTPCLDDWFQSKQFSDDNISGKSIDFLKYDSISENKIPKYLKEFPKDYQTKKKTATLPFASNGLIKGEHKAPNFNLTELSALSQHYNQKANSSTSKDKSPAWGPSKEAASTSWNSEKDKSAWAVDDLSVKEPQCSWDDVSFTKAKEENKSKGIFKTKAANLKITQGSKMINIKPTNSSTSASTKQGNEIKEEQDKELKLLKNRLSARKCRQKKKNYIKQLEEQVKSYQEQLRQYKNESNNEKSIENYLKLLSEKEKEIEYSSNKKKDNGSKAEFIENQRRLLSMLFLFQIKLMMPLECKIFQNKFIKLAQFESDDSIENILIKINSNIKLLNELYEFRKKTNSNFSKGKEGTAYKLYLFYENMKKYTEIFLSNYKIIG